MSPVYDIMFNYLQLPKQEFAVLRKNGGIEQLISVAKDITDPAWVESIAPLFSNLVSEGVHFFSFVVNVAETIQRNCVENGVIPLLISFASSPNPKVSLHGARGIGNLTVVDGTFCYKQYFNS